MHSTSQSPEQVCTWAKDPPVNSRSGRKPTTRRSKRRGMPSALHSAGGYAGRVLVWSTGASDRCIASAVSQACWVAMSWVQGRITAAARASR
jgi:hypothetical protein